MPTNEHAQYIMLLFNILLVPGFFLIWWRIGRVEVGLREYVSLLLAPVNKALEDKSLSITVTELKSENEKVNNRLVVIETRCRLCKENKNA